MTDEQAKPADTATPAATAAEPATPAAAEEWKPEPRTWSWKDLFTAPMLAFKPKCMLISVITLSAIGFFLWGWGALAAKVDYAFIGPAVHWIGLAIAGVIFGLGATLVSIFYRADLLDDEFLSLGEALGQFKKRLLPAIMVPVFLVGIVAGFRVLLYLGITVCSIPVLGGFLYALGYLLAFIGALVLVLLMIGVVLAIFVGPAVIAVRKHGWFDNVIDVFEAVGTKPHLLVASLAITLVMAAIGWGVPQLARTTLVEIASAREVPGNEVNRVEAVANAYEVKVLQRVLPGQLIPLPQMPQFPLEDMETMAVSPLTEPAVERARTASHSLNVAQHREMTALQEREAAVRERRSQRENDEGRKADDNELEALRQQREALSQQTGPGGLYRYGSGLLLSIFAILISLLTVGYALNVFLAGGMLTYLAVREDDYWDDEDLEDLDKLAKELEEEAKKEEEAAKAAEPAAKPSEPAPAPVVETTPIADTKPADDAAKPDSSSADASPSEPAKPDDKPADDKPST